MAKIRAYKLAEELGLDRVEFVEKAGALGVELSSAMASLDDAVADDLRKKLGVAKPGKSVVTERRVQSGSRATVIRRRKAAAPEPDPAVEAAPPVEDVAAKAPSPVPVPIAAEVESAVEEVASAPPVQPPVEPASPSSPAARGRAEPDSAPVPDRPAGPDRSGRQRKLVREVVNLREQERLARQATGRAPLRRQITVDPRTATSPRKRRRDAPAPAKPAAASTQVEAKRSIRVEGGVAVNELARLLGAKAPEVQRKLMALGTMVAVNQSVDVEIARRVASEFGFEVQDVGFNEKAVLDEGASDAAELTTRPPIVTVMGHVDHGKTSLLDAIRNAKVVAGEAGGITQHIGAYQAKAGEKKITFIDTPGHAAFTEMRARGAKVTDMVVLVVAATEGIMPQSVEAIEHARAAGVPIVVAINKCDLPNANPQQTRQRLMEHDLVPEEFGGDVICVDVSATQGTGLDKLLEMLLLQAELMELKADAKRPASGVILESRLDRGRGPVATALVQQGTLQRGEILVVGTAWGRVRAMEGDQGQRLAEAGPSVPVQLTGLGSVPDAGDLFHIVASERVAKDIVSHREAAARGKAGAPTRPKVSLEDFFAQAEDGGVKQLPIVIKADAHGSVEAVRDALLGLSTDAVKVDVISAAVGAVTETDVMLAKASGAIVVAFHVRPDPLARKAAEGQGVDIRNYQVIYDVADEVKKAMEGLLPPIVKEVFGGRAEVRETFNVPKIGAVGGCYIVEGTVRRNASCRLLRDGVQIYEGKLGSLRRFKDDVREVATGFECGIGIDGYNDIKIGDVIESYALEEQRATLE